MNTDYRFLLTAALIMLTFLVYCWSSVDYEEDMVLINAGDTGLINLEIARCQDKIFEEDCLERLKERIRGN